MNTTSHPGHVGVEVAVGLTEVGPSVARGVGNSVTCPMRATRRPGSSDASPTALRVTVDRDEITVIGELPAPESGDTAAAEGRITRWREDTREQRMKIADEAQAKYGRNVAWGARIGETGRLFTHLSVPAMTRLRQSERQVLDTLVDAGVARSRSEALAWCVRLVGEHTDDWLSGLREAMSEVERLRAEGPSL